MSQTLLRPLGSISAATGALTLVLLDSGLVTSWEPGFDEPRGDDLGGDPQRIIELLEADEDFVAATMKVGTGKALVLELEGATGEAEAYELPDGTLVLVEPTLSFWTDNFGRKVAEVRAMFEDAFDATRKASLAGKVEVPSGKLAVFDGNANLRPAARSHRAKLTPGNVARLGRDGDSIFVGLRPGTYRCAGACSLVRGRRTSRSSSPTSSQPGSARRPLEPAFTCRRRPRPRSRRSHRAKLPH